MTGSDAASISSTANGHPFEIRREEPDGAVGEQPRQLHGLERRHDLDATTDHGGKPAQHVLGRPEHSARAEQTEASGGRGPVHTLDDAGHVGGALAPVEGADERHDSVSAVHAGRVRKRGQPCRVEPEREDDDLLARDACPGEEVGVVGVADVHEIGAPGRPVGISRHLAGAGAPAPALNEQTRGPPRRERLRERARRGPLAEEHRARNEKRCRRQRRSVVRQVLMVEVDDVVTAGRDEVAEELCSQAPPAGAALRHPLGKRDELGLPAEPPELGRQLDEGLRAAERTVERRDADEEDPHRAVSSGSARGENGAADGARR